MLLSLVTDLMQGKSPVVAFTSLPRKMLGDLEDPLVGTEELPLNWSSDREQVCGEREREREREILFFKISLHFLDNSRNDSNLST